MTTKIKICTAVFLVIGFNGVAFGYGLLFGHNYSGKNRVDLYDTQTSQVVAAPFIKYSSPGTSDGAYTDSPTGIEIGPDGLVYVGSMNYGAVYVFRATDGEPVDVGTSHLGRVWRGSWTRPFYIKSSPNSDYLYWTNNYVSNNTALASIYRYNTATRGEPEVLVNPSDKATATIRGLAVSSDGTKLYAVARGARQVRVYDADNGSLLHTHSLPAATYPGRGPESCTFGPDGYLYVGFWDEVSTDYNEAQIGIFDVSTTPWTQVGLIRDGTNYYTWALHMPYDMTFSPDGKLYVANRDKFYYTGRVLIFENDGAGYQPSNWTRLEGPNADNPFGIVFRLKGFECGDLGTVYLTGDISGPDGEPDCRVDIYDFAALAKSWLGDF